MEKMRQNKKIHVAIATVLIGAFLFAGCGSSEQPIVPVEFTAYDNSLVYGTHVANALSLFQDSDIAIVIQTKEFRNIDDSYEYLAINYGAILTKDGNESTSDNMAERIDSDSQMVGKENYITEQSKAVYIVTFSDGGNADVALTRKSDASYYTGCLHSTNGLVDANHNTIGTFELGNAVYLLSSARFYSVLIKDPKGYVIGIFFKQT